MRRNNLKIVTVNIPESYLESIERLIGENGLYPSRSELIRCAVREFLIKELRRANEMIKYKEVEIEKLDDKNFVRVPIEKMDENNEPVREFKTYKIVKRLEY
jgi:Arc/MetJ-type ribon-helix-helix transcriptional regulator